MTEEKLKEIKEAEEEEMEEWSADENRIVLTLDDDSELECFVLDIFPLGEKQYIALVPVDEEDERVLLYEYRESGEDIDVIDIESDEEFDAVANEFERILGEEEEHEEDGCCENNTHDHQPQEKE